MLVERVINQLKERRENILSGHINCLPTPFRRFKKDFIGIEQASQIIITSYTKGGKTQLTLFLLFEALLYIYKNQDKARLKIFYFLLEETPEGITNRFMSYLLFKIDKIKISPKDLRSTDNENPLPEEILNKFNESPYKELLAFFEQTFIFSSTDTAMGIYTECQRYAEQNGTITYNYYKYKDEFGVEQEGKNFEYYTPNDPFEYRIVVIDHISLLRPKTGETLKGAVDDLSKNCAKYLRNRYKFTPIIIQQQNVNKESNESVKLGRVRPDKNGLSDSSYTANDCNILLGLFSPNKFELQEYLGYDVRILKDHLRFLEVVAARDGGLGGILPLYFEGESNQFFELPLPNDPEIEKWYNYAKMDDAKRHRVFLMFKKFKTFFNGITKGKK